MRFGFSRLGLAMLALLLIPNFLWMKRQPEGYGEAAAKENRLLAGLERIGEILVSAFSLLFADPVLGAAQGRGLLLAAIAALMLLYETYWLRYFRSGRTLQDFYSGLPGIPLAGATLPVGAFFLLAVYKRNVLLGAAVVLLGVGHIGIHWNHWKELQ